MDEGWSATASSLSRQITGDVRTPLLVLLGAVFLLLAMAITNVALLTLALTRRREHELAVRRAIGATGASCSGSSSPRARSSARSAARSGSRRHRGVRVLVLLLPPNVPARLVDPGR